MTTSDSNHPLKLIILGDSGVGKTSIMNRWVKRKFSNEYRATIGADFLFKTLCIDNQDVTLQIWDTAGQERFRSLGVAFYRGADCCVVVYDVTCCASFESVSSWCDEFLLQGLSRGTMTHMCSPPCANEFPFLILGNKCDVPHSLVKVDHQNAQKWCDAHGYLHAQTSARTGYNIHKVFMELLHAVLRMKASQRQPLYLPKPISLHSDFPSSQCPTSKDPYVRFKCFC